MIFTSQTSFTAKALKSDGVGSRRSSFWGRVNFAGAFVVKLPGSMSPTASMAV